ncbi:MAG: hypothetical protein GXY05_04265 [Clostridiales bacterium]|nr:hypothetical protein [Clostridiales bacterium]
MIGLAVGIAAGAVQFWLLTKFTRYVTSGGITPFVVMLGFLQLLLPFGALLAVAFLRRQDLLLAGVGISGALIGGLFVRFLLMRLKKKAGEDKND